MHETHTQETLKMKYANKQKQRGFSLIEVMIALVLGLILLGGAVSIFINNNAVYRLESELSRMQETGRFLIDMISKEVRMAGYTGCSSRQNIVPNVVMTSATHLPPIGLLGQNAITGYDYDILNSTWEPTLPAFISAAGNVNATVQGNTDVFIVQRASECGAQLTSDMSGLGSVVAALTNNCDFTANNVAIITDCQSADVFRINTNTLSANSQILVPNSNLSKIYRATNSQIHQQHSNTFFIAGGTSGDSAIWMATWDPATSSRYIVSELADGVDQMHILYGEDTTGDAYADIYVGAATVADWARVRSIRVLLLLSSDDNVTTEPRAFTFNGANVNGSNDRRLRLAFSTTITLRNRLP